MNPGEVTSLRCIQGPHLKAGRIIAPPHKVFAKYTENLEQSLHRITLDDANPNILGPLLDDAGIEMKSVV